MKISLNTPVAFLVRATQTSYQLEMYVLVVDSKMAWEREVLSAAPGARVLCTVVRSVRRKSGGGTRRPVSVSSERSEVLADYGI